MAHTQFSSTFSLQDILFETPIDTYGTIGDFSKRSSFGNAVDRKLVTHPLAIEKIKRQWQKTPFIFDIWMINDKRVNNPRFREVGVVDEEFVRNEMKVTEEELPINSDHITVLFTGNYGAERVPLTGWVMAHRFGHAINASRSDKSLKAQWDMMVQHLEQNIVARVLEDVYEIRLSSSRMKDNVLLQAAHQLGTMKSAREGNLRSWYEWSYELLAQYMLTGHIKFNVLPEQFITSVQGFGRKTKKKVTNPESMEMYNRHDLAYYASEIEGMLEGILEACEGKVFVM